MQPGGCEQIQALEERLAEIGRLKLPSFSINETCQTLVRHVHGEIDRYYNGFVPFLDRIPQTADGLAAFIKHLKAMMLLEPVLVESRVSHYLAMRAHFDAVSGST